MSIVLNEKEWVLERIFSPNPKDKKSEVLSRLTKFYSSEGLSKSETAKRLEEYLLCLDSAVSLPKWSKTIEKYVKKYYGEPLLQIDFVPISKEELEVIDSLKGEQTKRLAFTLLCLSKYQRKLNHLNDYWVCVKESEIMRLANINTSLERRCAMFSYLNECGLIEFSKRIDNTNVRVCFADKEPPLLKISDFRNLGFQYMMHCGKPYFVCGDCKIVTRYQNPSVGRRQVYCKSCLKKRAVWQKLKKA